jgi:hypothetical protein
MDRMRIIRLKNNEELHYIGRRRSVFKNSVPQNCVGYFTVRQASVRMKPHAGLRTERSVIGSSARMAIQNTEVIMYDTSDNKLTETDYEKNK